MHRSAVNVNRSLLVQTCTVPPCYLEEKFMYAHTLPTPCVTQLQNNHVYQPSVTYSTPNAPYHIPQCPNDQYTTTVSINNM